MTVAVSRTYPPGVMVAGRSIFLLATIFSVSQCALLVAADSAVDLGPRQAVVLLTNGEVLRGKVSRAGDQFFVWIPAGEIRLPAKRVQRVCDTIDDAYVYLSQSATGSVDDRLELVAWCLRYNLLGYAANELREVMVQEPENPRIAIFARRLELARKRPAVDLTDGVTGVRKDNPPKDSASEPAPFHLPPGAFAEFTSRLQPLLINKCASAGCHGSPTESTFRLSRMFGGRSPTRRQTGQNLIEVLRWIDKEQPAKSPLLQQPLNLSHGGSDEPVFTDADRSQYLRLLRFVNLVVNKPPQKQVDRRPGFHIENPPVDSSPKRSQQPETNDPELGADGDDITVSGSPAAISLTMKSIDRPDAGDRANPLPGSNGLVDPRTPTLNGDDAPDDEALVKVFEPKSIQRGAIIERFVPVDEFDPAIFNRRYFRPKKQHPPSQAVPEQPAASR